MLTRGNPGPPAVILQVVASVAATMLGEVLGQTLTAKLVVAALGAGLAAFLTAPGRRHRRRIVAVALLLALLDLLKGAASALASTRARERAATSSDTAGAQDRISTATRPERRPEAAGRERIRDDWTPRHPFASLVAAVAGFAIGTGITAAARGLNTEHQASGNVPDVGGVACQAAVKTVKDAGFKPVVESGNIDADGPVVTQEPRVGETASRGSSVKLTCEAP